MIDGTAEIDTRGRGRLQPDRTMEQVPERRQKMSRLNERLAKGGFRFTPQRERVYSVLLKRRDHPTAEEVFIRAKQAMPEISRATVYNCLEALVQCGTDEHSN